MTKSTITRERLQEITLRLTRLDVLETILRNELGLPCESPIPDISEKIYDMKRSRIYSVVPEEWTIADAVKFCRETGRQDAGAALDAWNACRAAMLQAEPVTTANKLGNSPVIPDTWIPVSERMPPSRHEVLVGCWWGEKPRWCCKWATYIPGHPDAQSSGWLIPGASWTPTHWMPLPNPPKE